jgi:small subunit ribosomal protein S4
MSQKIKKKWHSPLYKKICKLRENVQNREKLLTKFKAQKWKKLIKYLQRQRRYFRKNKIHDHSKFKLPRFASHGTAMKKKYKNSMQAGKKFSLFYGGLPRKYLKKQIKTVLRKQTINPLTNTNKHILIFFESRLDSILYRAHFSLSIKNAQQLIIHGHIIVNGNVEKRKDYPCKTGDIIEIKPDYHKLILRNIRQIRFWPIPPDYLYVNYKTLEIILGDIKETNFYFGFPFWLDLPSVIFHYKRG